jgi:UDP-N-acetylmuramoyl-tripeptide--D-alanyl-D-alanine ligase
VIARGISKYRGVDGRMSRRSLGRDITLIDDTYNANPQSMAAAIASLARLRGGGRAVAVLGTMGELGENAEEAHREMGRCVHESGIELLVTVGGSARDIADGALKSGMSPKDIHSFESMDEAEELVRSCLKPHDWILVKGSRAARMEQLVEALASGERE